MQGFDEHTEMFDFDKNNASRLDAGPIAGARIEYVLEGGSISVDVGYGVGLIDLQRGAGGPTRNSNRTLVLGVTYLSSVNF